MKKLLAPWMSVSALAMLGLVAACADAPTPAAPTALSSSAIIYTMTEVLSQGTTDSTKVNQATIGDTVVTVFVLGTNASRGASVPLGFRGRIEFPYQVGSVCDPLVSSYGPGTWDSECTPLRTNITITARTWLNPRGKLQTDFQPALRFVPRLSESVTLFLKDPATAGTRIDYCTLGVCVDESLADPTLATRLDKPNGAVSRIIKHFSGYTVIAD